MLLGVGQLDSWTAGWTKQAIRRSHIQLWETMMAFLRITEGNHQLQPKLSLILVNKLRTLLRCIALNSRYTPHLMPNNNRQLQCPLFSRLVWQISWLFLLSSLQLRRWCYHCCGVCQIPRWSSSTWLEEGREMTPQLDTVARSLISDSPLTPLLLLLF